MEEVYKTRNHVKYLTDIEKKKEGVAKTLKDPKTKALFRKYSRNKINADSKVQFHSGFETIAEVSEPIEINNNDMQQVEEEEGHPLVRK